MNTPTPFEVLEQAAKLKKTHSRKEIAEIMGKSERQIKRYLYKYRKTKKERAQSHQTGSHQADNVEEFIQSLESCAPNQIEKSTSALAQLQALAKKWEVDEELIDVENINFWDLSNFVQDEKIIIVFLGDVHWGSPHCNRKLLFDILRWVASTENAFILLMGDLIEMATKKSVGAGVYEQVQSPQEQIKDTIAYLQPIRHKLLGYFMGNHEFRAKKSLGIDVADIIADVLKIPYLGFTKLTTVKVGEQHYDIVGTHGNSGSKKPHTKLAKVFELADIYDADLYVMGHVHEILDATKVIRRRVGEKLETIVKYFLLTGHFLNWKTSYAEMAAMSPSNLGAPCAILYEHERKISIIK